MKRLSPFKIHQVNSRDEREASATRVCRGVGSKTVQRNDQRSDLGRWCQRIRYSRERGDLILFAVRETERTESRRGETQLGARGSEERSGGACRSGVFFEISMLDKSMPAKGGAEEGRSGWFWREVGGGRWEMEREEPEVGRTKR